jgi:hypothetical protein
MGGNLATPRRMRCRASQAFARVIVLVLGVCNAVLADPPAATPAGEADGTSYVNPTTLPQENFFSSVKESLRLGFDHEEVRGHFDLGAPPNSHRYYCLVDTKTRVREPNGVLGQPVPMPDGTTGLKIDSVSLYGCDKAEKQGMLVTAGYLLKAPVAGAAAAASASPPQPPPPPVTASIPAPSQPTLAAPTLAPPVPAAAVPAAPPAPAATGAPTKIDVAGVALGMSLDEVRTVLKSKKLREYKELSESLSYLDSSGGAMQSIAGGRFVSVVAAWTPSAAADTFEGDGESYQVMFTPVPGRERAMAIVHSVGYSPANAVREVALESGLVAKYGGFADSSHLPDSPTWRFQSAGNAQVGDSCNRRGLFGGLGELNAAGTARENLALKTVPDEFRFQTEHCGIAMVTEDHYIANGGALREDRLVTRFTVTAYSPSIAYEGAASAARLIQAGRGALNKTGERPKDQAAPNL